VTRIESCSDTEAAIPAVKKSLSITPRALEGSCGLCNIHCREMISTGAIVDKRVRGTST